MKKSFIFIAMALVMMVGCNKPGTNNGGSNNGGQASDELISIDAKFDDWAAAEAAGKVVSCKNNKEWEEETVDESLQRIDALKLMKVCSDKYNIYVYVEVDMTVVYAGGVPNWAGEILGPAKAMAADIYFDADANDATGGINWVWSPVGWEYGFEASVFSENAEEVGVPAEESLSGALFKFTGKDGQDIWEADPPLKENITGEGLFDGNGVKVGDIVKYEFAFTRAYMPKLGKNIKVGVEVLTSNWMLCGVLPQSTSKPGDEGATWTAGLLAVTLE